MALSNRKDISTTGFGPDALATANPDDVVVNFARLRASADRPPLQTQFLLCFTLKDGRLLRHNWSFRAGERK